MIGTHQLSQNIITPGFGVLCNCCCDKEIKVGGKPTSVVKKTKPNHINKSLAENPFVSFTPVAEPVPVVKPVKIQRISKRDILRPSTAERRLRSRVSSVLPLLRIDGPIPDSLIRDAFQKYLKWEEDEFLAVLLALDEDDCCYDYHCD